MLYVSPHTCFLNLTPVLARDAEQQGLDADMEYQENLENPSEQTSYLENHMQQHIPSNMDTVTDFRTVVNCQDEINGVLGIAALKSNVATPHIGQKVSGIDNSKQYNFKLRLTCQYLDQ